MPTGAIATPFVERNPIMVKYAPILLFEVKRTAWNLPSPSSAISASICMSRPWSSASSASDRSQVHLTGRPTRFDAQATSGTST